MNKRLLSLAISVGLILPQLSFTIEPANHSSFVEPTTDTEQNDYQDKENPDEVPDEVPLSTPHDAPEGATLLNQPQQDPQAQPNDASLEEQFEKYNTTSTDALEAYPTKSKNKTWVNIALAVTAFIVATVAILLVAKTDGKNHAQP